MNHIYKVIWNTVTQTWVAVSELSRAKGKTKSSKTLSAVVLAAVSAGAIVGDAEAAIVEGQGDGISIQSQNRNTKVAKAEGVTAIAIGYDVSSKGTSALAIGMQTQATGEKTVAIGHLSKATGSESTALGVKAEAKGNGDIALGKHAVAQGGANGVTGSAALGDEAKATGAQSAAVGGKSNASGSHAVASGYNTQATGGSSSAIGDAAEASGDQSTAVGVSSEAKGDQSAALGMQAHAHGSGSIAAGVASQATQAGTTAIGGWTEATAEKATAVGNSAHANANQATALGHNTQATGEFSTATGVSSRASGSASVATGKNATASAQSTIAVGDNAQASGANATSIGTGAIAKNESTIAIGNGAKVGATNGNVAANNGIAIGTESESKNEQAIAVGKKAIAAGNNSIALGNATTTTGGEGVAIGNTASASHHSVAFGSQAKATAAGGYSSAFGNESEATAADASAIGNTAKASAVNATSVGAHSNVTAAAENGSALGRKASVTAANGTALGSLSSVTAQNGTAVGTNATVSTAGGVALGQGSKSTRAALDGNNITISSQGNIVSSNHITDKDNSPVTDVYAPVRLINDSSILERVKNTIKGTAGAVSLGNDTTTRQLTNLAPGSADSDAVNVAQLKAVVGGIVKYNVTSPDNSITIDSKDETTDGVRKTTFNVKMNTTAVKDAAAWNLKEGSETGNGEQVRGGDTVSFTDTETINVARNGKTLTFNANTASMSADGNNEGKIWTSDSSNRYLAKTKNVVDAINASGWILQANGNKVGLVNPGDKVNIASGNGITVTPTTEANGVSKITINATVAGIKAGNNVTVSETGGVYTINATDTNTQASVSKATNSPIRINATGANNAKNYELDVAVDDTTISKTNGVLKAVTGNLNVNGNGNLNTPQTGSALVNATTLTNVVNNTYWKAAAGGNHADGKTNLPADQVKASSTVTFNAGKNLTVDHSVANNFTFALNNVVDLTNAGSLTIGGTTVTNDGVTIAPKEAGKTNVTLTANGLDNGGNKIVNVAAGKDETDAVNVKQLNDSISTETVRKADVTNGDNNIVEVDPTAEAGKGAKGATYNISVKESAVKNIAKTAVKVVNGKNTTVTPGDDSTDNSKTYAVDVKGDLTEITSITNTAGSGKVEFKDNGIVNVAGDSPIKLDGKTGDITGLTNKTLDGTNFAKSGRAATEEQLDIVNKKFDNKVSLGGDTGETTKKALSTDGGIKFNVKAADGNKVVTTKAEGDNVNINFSGEEAAKVIDLKYKSNGDETKAKTVKLSNGLDFTNGTHTTAEVDDNGVVKFNVNTATVTVPPAQPDTFTGKFDAPTTDGVATIKNVVDVVNNSGWKISQGAESRGIVKAGDEVSFVGTGGTTVTVEGTSGKRTVTVSSTLGAGEKGEITAVTEENKAGTEKVGQVKPKTDADKTKVTTVENVANMINSAKWFAKASNTTDEVTDANKTDDADNADGQAMSAGDKLTLKAGKNLRVKRDGADFTFALNNTVDLTNAGSLTIGGTTVTNDGVTIAPKEAGKTNVTLTANGLDNGGNKIVNVAAGKDETDAVNVKQLNDSISTETVRKADVTNGDNNIVEVDPTAEAGKGAKGATYNISVKESAVKNIAKTAVKVVNGKNTTVTPGDDSTDNSKTYAVDVKGDLTEITSITNTAGSGKVEFKDNGIVNVAGDSPIKLDGKTGDITGLTNKTLDGTNFAKSGRAATEEQLDIVNKKFDNKVSLGGDTGETTKKALSTDGGIKFNVKAADGNKVVTTKAEGDNVNINFSGEEAAKVIDLKYKSNGDETKAKTVKLSNGLDFTNGTHTTAEVDDNGVVKFNVNTATVTVPPAQPDTFTGKFDAPTTDGVATIKNVVDVVNNSGWKISQGAESRGIVKAGDEVSFVGTGGTTVTVEGTSGKRTVTVSSTLGAGEKGEITAVTEENKAGTEKVGQVKPKTDADKTKVTTVENVANMINSAKWFAKADNSEDDLAETKNDNGEAVNAGSELTFKAGKNLHVNRTDGVFTFALDSVLKDLTSTTYKNGGNTVTVSADTNGDLHISKPKAGSTNETVDAKITGVAKGTEDNDAVNVAQLKSTERHITPTTYTYNDTDKSVTLTYTDGNGNVVANTEAKIDLSGLANKIKDYSFKTNATGSNLVGTGTETTVASGKSVNFAASDNLTLKQDVNNGNVTYTYGLKNQVVVGEKGTPGADGKPGKDGVDGSIGVNGKDGSAVAINGKDGSIGLNGKDGKNGLTIKGDKGAFGVDGTNGKDGKDGMTRIVYTDNNNVKHEVATLDDGQKYAGDNYVAAKDNQAESNVIAKKANERLDIVGGAKGNLTEGNIGVNAKDGKLHVQLAEKVNLGDKGSVTIGDTVVNNNGITINSSADPNGVTNKTVSLTNQGLNNGGNKITNVAEGENDTDAVNVKQLKAFKTEVGGYGWNLSVNNGKDTSKITKDTTVDLNNDDGNIKIAKNGSNVTLSLGPDVGLGKAGKDGKDGSLAVRGKDGASVEISGKDGSIGLTGPKGKDGTPGASATITVEKGTTTVNDGRDGDNKVNRIVYTDKDKNGNDIKREVATLDDGLKFKGDSKEVINRTLGSQMNITGGADENKLTDKNIGVVYDKATNGLKVKLSKDVNLGDNGTITIGDTVVNKDGLTINGGPSVTKGGVNAGNQSVTNVKDGVADNDAVNVKQLKAAKTEVEAGDHIDVTSREGANGQTIYKVSVKGINDTSAAVKGGSDHVKVTKAANTHKDGSTTVTDYTVDLSDKTKGDIGKGVKAYDKVTNEGLTFNADKGSTGVKKLGSKVSVNGDGKNITTTADENGVKVSMKDDIKVNSVTAKEVKVGDVNINENGINAGGKRITNVAPGKDGTDAVNVNQLKYVAGNISNQINNVDKGLRAGIAGALASGGLYHVTTAGKSMVSVGAGTYRGQNALAVGYSRLSDNGKVGVKFTVNSNSQGHSGASASVGYQW